MQLRRNQNGKSVSGSILNSDARAASANAMLMPRESTLTVDKTLSYCAEIRRTVQAASVTIGLICEFTMMFTVLHFVDSLTCLSSFPTLAGANNTLRKLCARCVPIYIVVLLVLPFDSLYS